MMPRSESGPMSTGNMPRSFVCPLTMEVMVDPVIDAEGNTFEKKALLHWLSLYGVSPVSRQPLNANLVVPNFALRDTIHEVMGSSWVAQRSEELELQYNASEDLQQQSCSSLDSSSSSHYSTSTNKSRGKIQCYLRKLAQDVGSGRMQLELDETGVCMFSCENMTIVVEVPAEGGFFYIYTVVSVPFLSEDSKDQLLELNRLQSETRGGTLSVKKHPSGQYDIYFTYSDRIAEISAADFCNIVPNFIETAAKLKEKFQIQGRDGQQGTPSLGTSTANTTMQSQQAESAQLGLAAKFL